jgi:hypothetical protein
VACQVIENCFFFEKLLAEQESEGIDENSHLTTTENNLWEAFK